MRVLRRASGGGRTRRRRPVRISGAGPFLLGCLPVLAAVLALLLSACGGDGTRPRRTPPEPTARPAPHTAPEPRVVPRSAWLDDFTRHAQPPPRYDDKVVAVFVHHTDTPNGYDCADTPRIVRDLYSGQTGGRQWDDLGYNFLVDRCGTVYEGRAGGVDRPVTGAHTQGFNHRTTGIAAIGTFTAGAEVPRAMTDAIAALAAWKLGLADVDPRGVARLVSSNDLSLYPAGHEAVLPALAGHQDGYATTCPGAALMARLPAVREAAAGLQGRRGPTGPAPSTGTPQPARRVLRTPAPTVSDIEADRRWGT
ncbi:peptidoglycan recognition protein [Streptomyces griseoviridis]|uniref:peptidoglycan recognition protein family protein n=1 Tax=Streptomyces griseoviridis TaxID=45398 RepID=UPI00340D3198